MNGFLLNAIIYIVAAIVCVPIAKKLGMGSVLGYLIAGILIGPYVFGFIQDGQSGQDIMHTTEFGVVMMLFLIGLELEPKNLWKMKSLILKVGLTQVLVTTALIFGLAIGLNYSWQIGLTMGMAMALSSTAIVLQSLKEKNQLDSSSGKMSFGVLLMQDIAVIPILAALPLLASEITHGATEAHGGILENQPGWIQTLLIFGAIGLVVVLGRFGFGPLLNWVSKTKLRELFTASALLIVVGIAFLMGMVGLSPALGTFLAGVILANSPYKHALESDLEPFKGLLLGIFFMAVGATINFDLITSNPAFIILFTLGVMSIKAAVLSVIGYIKKLSLSENLAFSFGLAQVSEFSFVIYAFALQLGFLAAEVSDTLMAITALSMTFTPILGLILDKTILTKLNSGKKNSGREQDSISEKHDLILVGFSHFGSTLGRFLRANGVESTVLDFDPDRVDFLRKMGFKVFYGDATRVDMLHAAGAENAKILISALNSEETNRKLIEVCRENFPNLQLMIRAKNRYDAYEFLEMGIENIYREHLDTSIRMGEDALKKLGFRSYTVHRLAAQFKKYDEDALKVLVQYKNNQNEYISKIKKQIEQQESMISGELSRKFSLNDHAWDSEQMKS
ncbi:monovalent cation:proton antiporter-2 (CPA2) family protein [Algoriphagus mannitolivorans]|uniref:monovalent cation:proton antiporter-2 (CPA2) family protein n=1 Tax=Algoriphagus mannitolivorans TaxID=226504 RepID=UPI000402CE74|nr:monovalent cation:proton antiporter-2 (CPA2) family protein [Algoriphagus mannitolivorans]